MTLAFFVLMQYRSVTDRQTNGQTDIPPLAIPAVCIARYANALVKMDLIDILPYENRYWKVEYACLFSMHIIY